MVGTLGRCEEHVRCWSVDARITKGGSEAVLSMRDNRTGQVYRIEATRFPAGWRCFRLDAMTEVPAYVRTVAKRCMNRLV